MSRPKSLISRCFGLLFLEGALNFGVSRFSKDEIRSINVPIFVQKPMVSLVIRMHTLLSKCSAAQKTKATTVQKYSLDYAVHLRTFVIDRRSNIDDFLFGILIKSLDI
jgi:hypothetical protein